MIAYCVAEKDFFSGLFKLGLLVHYNLLSS